MIDQDDARGLDHYRDCRPIEKDTEAKVWENIELLFGHSKKVFANSTNFNEDFLIESIDRIELIMEVEECFSIAIEDDEEGFETIQDLIDLVESKLSRASKMCRKTSG